MQLTHIITAAALFGGALAKHGCITDSPFWGTYSKADAQANIQAHENAGGATHDTNVPYRLDVGESRICLDIHKGGIAETIHNSQIAEALWWVYSACCSGGFCYPGWAEVHVKDGYKTYATMSHKNNDCTQM